MCSSTGRPTPPWRSAALSTAHPPPATPPKQPTSTDSAAVAAAVAASVASETQESMMPASSSKPMCSCDARSPREVATRCQKRGESDMLAARCTSSITAQKRAPSKMPSRAGPRGGGSHSARRKIWSRSVSISACSPSLGGAPARQATSPKAFQKRRKCTRPPCGRSSRTNMGSAPAVGATNIWRTSSTLCRGVQSSTCVMTSCMQSEIRAASAL
mmetsp:Transcript_16681/g.48413  ORF Transcript_16681/g.48413 Transcript_16681/m.48413 type:complete len:215 (+) Transcript_16681:12-656(+)